MRIAWLRKWCYTSPHGSINKLGRSQVRHVKNQDATVVLCDLYRCPNRFYQLPRWHADNAISLDVLVLQEWAIFRFVTWVIMLKVVCKKFFRHYIIRLIYGTLWLRVWFAIPWYRCTRVCGCIFSNFKLEKDHIPLQYQTNQNHYTNYYTVSQKNMWPHFLQ